LAQFVIFRRIDELLTMSGVSEKKGRRPTTKDLGIITDGAVVVESGEIRWAGPERQLSSHVIKSLTGRASLEEVDCSGLSVLPAFVEAHTHSVFAGSRADEFEQRVQGATYQEISQRGGGILSTVHHTRIADERELIELLKPRVEAFIRQGVGTLEIKSGYGLDLETELKMLSVAGKVKGPRVVRTFLGPHALPESALGCDEYLDEVIESMLPAVMKGKLAERADVFIEKGFFSLEQGRRYLEAAKELGFGLTGHMDQLQRLGGGVLGAELAAQSVDHLVHISPEDVSQLSKSETVCVLLPTADFYLRMPYPPARALLDAGARVALATDFNPGSSPSWDLALVGVLARVEMRMTLAEVLAAYTVNAAAALGLGDVCGSIEAEKSADLILIDGRWQDLFMQVGHLPVVESWVKGKRIFNSRS
jgi:imidazolonepropionase